MATSCPSHAPSAITATTTNIRTHVRVYMRIGNRVAQMGFAARVGGAVRLKVWREGNGFCRLITHLRCSLANRARARPIGNKLYSNLPRATQMRFLPRREHCRSVPGRDKSTAAAVYMRQTKQLEGKENLGQVLSGYIWNVNLTPVIFRVIDDKGIIFRGHCKTFALGQPCRCHFLCLTSAK